MASCVSSSCESAAAAAMTAAKEEYVVGAGLVGAGGVTTNWDTEGGGLLDRETPAEWRRDSRSSVEDTGTSRAGLFRYKVCI
jgi:hypothetical protein